MTKPLTTKEKLVEAIREGGYDFVSACEESDKVIKEFLESKDSKRRYIIKHTGRVIELRKNRINRSITSTQLTI